MEQIQQHEWEDDIFPGSVCTHCKTIKSQCLNGSFIYRQVDKMSTKEEPACITRYPEQTERRSNCPACSMLEQGVKFRISPPHTCGKKNWQGGR